MTKYIFVTGGVVSGLGKGITAASLGRLLKSRGLKVAAQKLDPYINVDPGTMSPYQHGEVFVTEDGAETDLDLGHYERFIDEDLNKYSNLTTGKVYWNVLTKERRGEYLGETVQVIPHITGEIKSFIYSVGKKTDADIVITEIGGTTGDIESTPFLEAIRQVSIEAGRENCLFIHVTLVPYIKSSGEHKTKPTQHSVKELQSVGIMPNIIIARVDEPLEEANRQKIALFCNVKPDCVIENLTVPVLYEAPLMLERSHLSDIVCRELHLDCPPCDLTDWNEMLARIAARRRSVNIAIVGKYTKLHDAYLSVMESLYHAGYETGAVLLFDAAYESFITDGDVPHSIYEVNGAETCAIEFCSFSKTAGFTGTRCSYTVVPQALVRGSLHLNAMWLRRQTTKYNGVPYIVQRAAAAVFTEEGQKATRAAIDYYRANAAVIAAALDEAGIWYCGGKNSPYIWMQCPGGMKSWDFFDHLLEHAGVVGTPGAGFGAQGEGYFRLTGFGDAEKTRLAAQKLKEAVRVL